MQVSTQHSETPNFSIVVPVRNGEKYIHGTLESILNQTYPHFEIIILENRSQDKTLEIVTSFADPRISIIPAERPLSIEENWARIVTLDLKEYMTILGHDDLLYPTFLEDIAQLIEAEPDASLYQTHFHFIDAHGQIIRPCPPIPYKQTGDELLRSIHGFETESSGTGYVARSTDYKKIGGLDASLPLLIGADELAWYQLGSISYKACSPNYDCAFRFHATSTSYSIDLYTLYQAFEKYVDALKQTDYFQKQENQQAAFHYIYKRFTGRHHRWLIDLIKSQDKAAWQRYYETRKKLRTIKNRTLPVPFQTLSVTFLLMLSYLPFRGLLLAPMEKLASATRQLRRKL